MKGESIHRFAVRDHDFGQDRVRPGERKTVVVIVITATMMLVEIVAGSLYGSMALLADGLHMASHAAALSISAFAYVYARRHARDARFSFGTGKVNALGGFAGAILLAVFAALMAVESLQRLFHPVAIAFGHAIVVAVIGLAVNGLSVLILQDEHDYAHEDGGHAQAHHHDHNLRSAYLHVLADALTSILAIVALVAGKYAGLMWLDPAMGVVGAALVARWSLGLLRDTSLMLLDTEAPRAILEAIRSEIERDDQTRLTDLHVWSIAPGLYAAELAIATSAPLSPAEYRARIPESLGIIHATIQVDAIRAEK